MVSDEAILRARAEFQKALEASELRRLRYYTTKALHAARAAQQRWMEIKREGKEYSAAKVSAEIKWDIYAAHAIEYEARKGQHIQRLDRRLLAMRTKEERAAQVFAELNLPNPPVPLG